MYLAANRSSPTLPGLLPAPLHSRAAINHSQQTKEKRPSNARSDTGNSGSGNPALRFWQNNVRWPHTMEGSESFSPSSLLIGEAAHDTFCRNKPNTLLEWQHHFQLCFCNWMWWVDLPSRASVQEQYTFTASNPPTPTFSSHKGWRKPLLESAPCSHKTAEDWDLWGTKMYTSLYHL